MSLILLISCSTKELSNKPNKPIINEQTPPLLKEQPKPELNFSTGACDEKIDPYSKPVAGILSQEWKDNVLIVKTYLKTYCGGANITSDFNIEGSNLILNYNIKTEGPVTSCLCPHMLIYEISNLEHKDYTISIQPQ